MAVFPQLSNPPIAEAQLNFHANASEAWDACDHLQVISEVFSGYTERRPIHKLTFQFSKAKISSSTAETSNTGYFLRFTPDSKVLQIRRDGFAYSRLQPYTGWQGFIPNALETWDTYKQTFRPSEIEGLSLRYINRLVLPRLEFDADRDAYFTTAPRLPPGTEEEWEGFASFTHTSVYRVRKRFLITAVLASDLSLNDETATAVLLDINVAASPEEVRTRNLLELLEEMRKLKNQAFFSIATPLALAPYA